MCSLPKTPDGEKKNKQTLMPCEHTLKLMNTHQHSKAEYMLLAVICTQDI